MVQTLLAAARAPMRPVRSLLLALLCWAARPGQPAADQVQAVPADAIQLLADLTLIDHACRNVSVDFGRGFQAAEAMGVRAGDAMPTGAARARFEAATRSRLDRTAPGDLCDGVARAYRDNVPGLLRIR